MIALPAASFSWISGQSKPNSAPLLAALGIALATAAARAASWAIALLARA
jgi:hypothetical protein